MAASLILNRYRRLSTLGTGGSATVDLCWDTRIQRRVAIKRLAISPGEHADAPGLAEARMAARLNHPSIVSVYDFETRDDEAFLIMEAIEGPSLRTLVKDTPAGAFDLDIVTSISTAVANALAFAHEHHVLHLDIKPGNILTTPSGTAKVSDFGIAQLVGAGGVAHASGGTIGYMPPEQLRGEALDERCDVFAFALVVYEMLTGKNPFRAKTVETALKAVESRKPAVPSSVRDDVDSGIDDVLLTALSPDAGKRYASIAAFFTDLEPYLGDAQAGIDKLSRIVIGEEEAQEDADESTRTVKPPPLDRVPTRARTVCGRVLNAALCWWVAFLGADLLGSLLAYDTPMAALAACLAAMGALVKPAFGTLLALATLAAALVACPSACTPLGIATLAVTALWYAALGRGHLASRAMAADANCALVIAPLGLVGLTPLAFFAAGLCLPVKRALLCSLVSALLAIVLGVSTASASLLSFDVTLAAHADVATLLAQLLANPTSWIVVLSWVLATVCLSLLASRGGRVSSTVGVVIAACLMLAGHVVGMWAASAVWHMPQLSWALSIGSAMILACIGIGLGARHRSDRED